jgi:phage terminase large subunit-like protein
MQLRLLRYLPFGTALIQEFKTSDFSVVAVKPEFDKKIRMAIQAAKFENGQVFFPKEHGFEISKMSFSRFQTAGTTIRSTA